MLGFRNLPNKTDFLSNNMEMLNSFKNHSSIKHRSIFPIQYLFEERRAIYI